SQKCAFFPRSVSRTLRRNKVAPQTLPTRRQSRMMCSGGGAPARAMTVRRAPTASSGSGRESMFRNILVPTDGTELPRAATLRAVGLAHKEGAWVTFLHVLPERPASFFGGEGGMFVKQVSPEEFDAQVQRDLDTALADAEALARASNVPFERVVKKG